MPKKRLLVRTKRKDVSQRLLESGLRFFALHGFDGATVREICDDSESNLAAINYYFKNKLGFFREVCAYGHRLLRERYLKVCEAGENMQPWERLRKHIEAMVESAYDSVLRDASWLYMRELMSPQTEPDAERECANSDHEEMEEQTWRLMSDLLGAAATRENIVLLHYTYVSLSLFMIVQQQVERMSRRESRFGVNVQLEQHHLEQYILDIMHNTIERMKKAAAGLRPAGEADISPAQALH